MAIDAATLRSDFSGFLTPELSAPIFSQARQSSVVQQLARQVPLGAEGKSIPVVTGKPTAGWVDEGGQKPASKGSRTLKTITPKKLAAIVVTSEEVVRANPGGYVTDLRADLAEAFGLAFDAAALHDKLADGTGTGPFSTYLDQTTKVVEVGSHTTAQGGVHADLNDALSLLVSDRDANGRGKRLTGWAFDSVFEPIFNAQTDSTGRPLFIDSPVAVETAGVVRIGRTMGRPSFIGDGVGTVDGSTVLGYAGDWTQTAWGVVGGINYSVSNQATVTIDGELVSLWENNLVAVRAEAEYGWLVNDVAAFVKFTNTVPTASA